MKEEHITAIEEFWQIRDLINPDYPDFSRIKQFIDKILDDLEAGKFSVCQKNSGIWEVNQWLKKAILLAFRTSEMKIYDGNCLKWYDKIPVKFSHGEENKLKNSGIRIVPGAFIRKGSYIANNTVIMPSFVNIGAHIGSGSLIDSWATVGSCAYIGKNCHISGGAGIGGVLEPLQAKPVIIEDNCFIGARSEIVEGVIIEEGAVISMGVFISSSTKIVDRNSGEITYGKIPAYSVVVPGFLPPNKVTSDLGAKLPGLACAVIIKKVDKQTREKTNINELLRD